MESKVDGTIKFKKLTIVCLGTVEPMFSLQKEPASFQYISLKGFLPLYPMNFFPGILYGRSPKGLIFTQ